MSLAYFPMFPTDFDADTGHLTFAEDGAYNRLLRLSWRCHEAKMPDDLDWICRKARASTPEDRALIEGVLAEFFTRKGGKVFSRRLHEEWAKANDAHAKRISAGSKGGQAKALKLLGRADSNATPMLYQPEPEPEPEPEPVKKEDAEAKASVVAIAPPDPDKVMFDSGLVILRAAGKSDGNARSILGKWRKAHGTEAVIAALGKAQREGAIDPVSFIEGVFRQTKRAATVNTDGSDWWGGRDL